MNQSPIIVLPEIAQLIDERKSIQQNYEETMNGAKVLEQLVKKIPHGSTNQSLSHPLTNEATPPKEVVFVIKCITQVTAKISEIEEKIQENYVEIEEIKSNEKALIMRLSVIGSIVFLTLLLFFLYAIHVL